MLNNIKYEPCNKIFFLAGDMFMLFSKKTNNNYKNYKKENINQIGINEACSPPDLSYGVKRTASDALLPKGMFYMTGNPKNDKYQRGLLLMIYNFFYKNSSVKCVSDSTAKTHQHLTNEL